MSRSTKVSKYRTGEIRFGRKGSPDKWDSSVKVSVLSPEELAAYRNGERGGSKLFTYEDFLELEKQGLSKQQIADKMGISVATLYNRESDASDLFAELIQVAAVAVEIAEQVLEERMAESEGSINGN